MANAKCNKKLRAKFKIEEPRLFFELKKQSKCHRGIVAVLRIEIDEVKSSEY